MPKPKNSSTNGAVAAADDYIQDAVAKIGKHHDTIVAHRQALEDELEAVRSKAASDAVAAAKELASVKESLQRQLNEALARAQKAEAKVSAAFGKLAE